MLALEMTFKARNGRRTTLRFTITDREAKDPIARADAVNRYSAARDRMVNWNIVNV